MLRQLEAMLLVMDKDNLLLVSGTGEVIEPDDGILAIGSGGNYALAAGRALKQYAGDHLTAKEIAKAALTHAADICVFTNHKLSWRRLENERDKFNAKTNNRTFKSSYRWSKCS